MYYVLIFLLYKILFTFCEVRYFYIKINSMFISDQALLTLQSMYVHAFCVPIPPLLSMLSYNTSIVFKMLSKVLTSSPPVWSLSLSHHLLYMTAKKIYKIKHQNLFSFTNTLHQYFML